MTKRKIEAKPCTVGKIVYDYLRNEILELRIMPGQKINISQLSNSLGVGRSPVRDALIQLTSEGLVITIPQRGTIVSKINIACAKDERYMRACVEQKIIEDFIPIADGDAYGELESVLQKQKCVIECRDGREFLKADDEFHAIMFWATRHQYSLNNIMNMSCHYQRIRLLSLFQNKVVEKAYKQHCELFELLKSKDVENAKNLINRHIVDKSEEETNMLCKYPDFFIAEDESANGSPRIGDELFDSLNFQV